MDSTKSIYVVYRGSQDIRNWITNVDAVKTTYTTFPDCKCSVHKGFFDAEQRVIAGVISQVKSLLLSKANYQVKVTGHSLGTDNLFLHDDASTFILLRCIIVYFV